MINQEVSKGTTYCPELKTYIFGENGNTLDPLYSKNLIDTVWECLYEKPEHRPTAFELKKMASEAIMGLTTDDDGSYDSGDVSLWRSSYFSSPLVPRLILHAGWN